ncbi:MAG: 16S rRNA (adenine(1518)-N(6)/adenine(1519)-N(6))-dimethyltransferase RsmA [Holosporales bacterium]|jgi:16S rRNA (adenine1518-N6/adenine1519-N6)-dimethyltransferase|nr:16S rRNA (adenine(1518)-N(6)/adenine(1519)-N(6))-dimethyltransferase RsmA [Holosporales bacterium]
MKIQKAPATKVSQIIREHCLLQNKRRSKAFGQNFLTDTSILRKIVDAAGEISGNVITEIGSGPGGLTYEILNRNPIKLIAIEKDINCINALQTEDVTFIHADAISYDFSAHYTRYGPTKVIANLPYNASVAILLNLFKSLHGIVCLTLMFQKEVADRILAHPGTKSFGRLSVVSQYLTTVNRIMTLPPGAFHPAPKVHSTVIRMIPKEKIDYVLSQKLSILTKAVFQTKRKIIRNGLLNLWSREYVVDILNRLNIEEEARPETLSVAQFVELAKAV